MAADSRTAIAHVQLVDGYRFTATFPDVPGADAASTRRTWSPKQSTHMPPHESQETNQDDCGSRGSTWS
jgi:hypothetical protein